MFGFVSTSGKGPNFKRLDEIARSTEARGRHAWGMAWIDSAGRMRTFKQTGPVSDALGLLRMAQDARLLVGHCRYATQGDPDNNLNNHPHPADGGWIVHNGMIPFYRQVVRDYALHPVTDCDSELLGLLIENAAGRLIDRCTAAVESVPYSPLVLLGLWKPGRLVAVRQGNPLHMGAAAEGLYLGSLPSGLPGRVQALPDNTALEFTQQGRQRSANLSAVDLFESSF
ncbi:MAG TPA: class II glutamine amidotransferase [Gemmatimonadales bacterium]|nr:class II glutamine amidotransferase [Gemmatimonadales bacterium]